jgi:uncharacterized membrane protein YccC
MDPVQPRNWPTDGLADRIGRLRGRLADLSKAMPLRDRIQRGLLQGLLSAAGAIIAFLPTQILGLREGFWGAITAIAVLQGELDATRNLARDQITGATIGGLVGVGVMLTAGQQLPSYALAVLLSVTACWVVNVTTASRLSGITATIILLVPHTGTPQHMLVSRVGEVAWGVTVALTLVWLRARYLPAGRKN